MVHGGRHIHTDIQLLSSYSSELVFCPAAYQALHNEQHRKLFNLSWHLI